MCPPEMLRASRSVCLSNSAACVMDAIASSVQCSDGAAMVAMAALEVMAVVETRERCA